MSYTELKPGAGGGGDGRGIFMKPPGRERDTTSLSPVESCALWTRCCSFLLSAQALCSCFRGAECPEAKRGHASWERESMGGFDVKKRFAHHGDSRAWFRGAPGWSCIRGAWQPSSQCGFRAARASLAMWGALGAVADVP